jgi:hypothetical protein
MLASRTALRATRRVRVQSLLRAARRLESTTGSSSSQTSSSTNQAIIGGLVGGGIVSILGYGYYHYSGASTVVNAAHSAKFKVETAFKESTEQAPAPNEAIKWLKETAMSYARFIPGGKGYVDSAFDDIEAIQRKHGNEVNKIAKDAYDQIGNVSKEGASLDTVAKAWDVIQVYNDLSTCFQCSPQTAAPERPTESYINQLRACRQR